MLTIHERDSDASTGARPKGTRQLMTVIVILLLAAMVVYILTRLGELAYLRRLSTNLLLATLACQLVAQLMWNQAMLVPLRQHVRLGYWELFTVRSGGLLASYLVPLAGNIGVRLAYLRRRGLLYADFLWATWVSSVLGLLAAAILGVLALGVLWVVAGTPPAVVTGLAIAVLALSLVGLATLCWLPGFVGHPRFRGRRWVAMVSRHEMSRRAIALVLTASFGRHLFSFVSFGLLYQELAGGRGQFLAGGLVYAITSPLRIVMITPGNLGLIEWTVAAVGKLLAFDLATGLIVALVFRAMTLAGQGLGLLMGAALVGVRRESAA
jgi:hypothetical protein